ncbi:MAG: ABC transporter ATP-binding protein [Candidatus Thorarchaeota archaeon]
MIRIDDVSKRYGEVVALSRLNMHAREGSITGFVGPNGAGKSTTIRMIMSLARPDSGSVLVFGVNPYDNVSVRERIGFVSEHDDLYPWATVRNSIKMLARLNIPRAKDLDVRIQQALKDVGMAKSADRKVAALSKGMRQRTRIAASLIHSPDLLILDEPLKGLDPLGRRTIMNLLLKLNSERGTTILISSHVLEELEQLVDRITLIHRGQTVAEGNPERIRQLVYKYPHEVLFKSEPDNMKQITSSLLQADGLVSSLKFSDQESDMMECTVVTLEPERFFDELVRIAVEKNAPLVHVDAISESVERLFDYLVR